jgi:hypothetical protein
LVVVGLVFVSGLTAAAQQRAQIRSPQAAAPRPAPPAPPAADARFRNAATFRPAPFTPFRALPFRNSSLPIFPLVWGWGTLRVYYQEIGAPLKEGPRGGVQLDVLPWRASVFVDGARAGQVSDFNGYYKHLEVVAGPHEIMVLEPGYTPLILYVVVVPGRTITYRYTLNELNPS